MVEHYRNIYKRTDRTQVSTKITRHQIVRSLFIYPIDGNDQAPIFSIPSDTTPNR